MKKWFQAKVRYEKLDPRSGRTKKVIEPYLIDAITFSEAEERIYKSLEEIISGEFLVKDIAKSNFTDVFFYEQGELWFHAKVKYIDVDEETGKEKNVVNNMLVTADDAREAYDRIQESLKEMIVPFSVPSVSVSSIIDVFPYDSEKKNIEVVAK